MSHEQNPERHHVLVQYLLDDLTEEQRDRVEERLLADKDFQEDLAVAEEEVADRFVSGGLLPKQRNLLEEKFAGSPEWKDRIDRAHAMNRIEEELAVQTSLDRIGWPKRLRGFRGWRVRAPLVVLTSVAAFLVVWFSWSPSRKPNGASVSSPTPAPPTLSFVLRPAVRKGGPAQSDTVVTLPPERRLIELRLALDRDVYPVYQVALQSFGTGKTVSLGAATPFREPGVKSELRIPVDSSGLQPGRYTIILQASEPGGGVTDVAGYSFRVAGQVIENKGYK